MEDMPNIEGKPAAEGEAKSPEAELTREDILKELREAGGLEIESDNN